MGFRVEAIEAGAGNIAPVELAVERMPEGIFPYMAVGIGCDMDDWDRRGIGAVHFS